MIYSDIAHQRIYSQRLADEPFQKVEDVVEWLGAVQSQDYGGAKWALGLRLEGVTDAAIDQMFNDGKILRTHVMRPTWHFVTPADVRWMLELTAPRVRALCAYAYRQFELDDAIFAQTNRVLVKALQGGNQLTRPEIATALEQAGIHTENLLRVGHIIMRAELDGMICSGARRGKQFSYALLDERAPQAIRLERDEALAELVKRYFISHGPATAQDFAWWSGLTMADTKTGIEMVKSELNQEVVGEETYWFGASAKLAKASASTAYLLPNWDEITVGYTERSRALIYDAPVKLNPDPRADSLLNNVIVINARIVGMWKRTFKRGAAVIDIAPFIPLTDVENQAVASAAQRFGEFLDMPIVLLFES